MRRAAPGGDPRPRRSPRGGRERRRGGTALLEDKWPPQGRRGRLLRTRTRDPWATGDGKPAARGAGQRPGRLARTCVPDTPPTAGTGRRPPCRCPEPRGGRVSAAGAARPSAPGPGAAPAPVPEVPPPRPHPPTEAHPRSPTPGTRAGSARPAAPLTSLIAAADGAGGTCSEGGPGGGESPRDWGARLPAAGGARRVSAARAPCRLSELTRRTTSARVPAVPTEPLRSERAWVPPFIVSSGPPPAEPIGAPPAEE